MFCNTYHNNCFKYIKWLWFILVCFPLITITEKLPAQSFPFREYGVTDGLPQSQVTHLSQDSKGFIWIATRNGISRFDGIEFVNYFRKNGLPSNFVYNIIEDTTGNIWALSNGGLSKYNGHGFETFSPPSEFKGWTFPLGSTIDNNDNLFILGAGPEDKNNRIIIFKNGVYSDFGSRYKALDTLHVNFLYFDRSTNEMLLIDKYKTFWLWKDSLLSSLSERKFQYAYIERGNVLALSNDTVFRYANGKFEIYNFNSTYGRSEVNPKPTILNRELDFFDGRSDYKIPLSFNYLSYLIDKEDVLWFSSEGNLYRLLSTAFNLFSEKEIGVTNIWALAEDRNGHLWFGSLYNTLIEYDGKEFRERNEFKSVFGKNISFYKGSRKMANDDIWFSTNMGVLIWDGKKFTGLKGIPDNTQICYIYEDPDSKVVMIGTEKGLFILKNGNINLIPDFNDNNLGVIEGITKDDSGNYWLSGHRGVLKFDGKTPVPVRENILPQGYTYTIEKDNYGGLWVTSDEGLFFREKGSSAFITGLPEAFNRSANSIILMDRTHILVGRVSDICIIDLDKFYRKEKDYFRIYDNNDGFQGSDCLDNGIVKDKKGRFWILTSNNVVIFDPEKLRQNTHPPILQLTGFYYQTDSLTWEPVDKSHFFYKIPGNIKLKRYQNKVQITFSGISFTNPESVNLQYRLEGYDDEWTLPANKRFVVYEKLPPGHYRFQIKAINADGIETPEPLTMEFKVLPAFWQTTLFMVMALILILTLTVTSTLFIMKRRQLKQKEKERLKSELSRLQMSSVLRQFDPHFTFNVISSVGSLIMKGEKKTAYDYITKLSGLLRTVLSDGSIIIKPLSDELDFVRRYCELQKLRFKDRFNYNIVVDENIDLQRDIPKMAIQTFVENAIKHGLENRMEGGKIDIFVNKNGTSIEITVKDNGIGRAAAAGQMTRGTGHGLKIINGLFEVMNAKNISNSTVEISDLEENGISSGTNVRISIPDDYRFEFGRNVK